MNYTLDDRHRSLRDYVTMLLGAPPWKVRTEREEVPDDGRPVAVIESNSPIATIEKRVRVPQGDVRKMQGFSIMGYPEIKDTGRESKFEAERVAQLLDDLFTIGLEVGDNTEDIDPQTPIGWPYRMPVWDWAGVDTSGPDRGDRPAQPYGYAWIDNVFVRTIQDPLDHVRFTVACDLRMRWWQGGRLAPDAPLLTDIHPHYVP